MHHEKLRFAEVQYFFKLKQRSQGTEDEGFAMISLYSEPDPVLACQSFNTVLSCSYFGQDALTVARIKDIHAVIAMVPHRKAEEGTVAGDLYGKFFVVEKMGLDVMTMAGIAEVDGESEPLGGGRNMDDW